MLLGLARPETRGQWRMKMEMKSLPSQSRQEGLCWSDMRAQCEVQWALCQQGENLRAEHNMHTLCESLKVFEGWQSLHWLQLGYFTHWALNSRDSSLHHQAAAAQWLFSGLQFPWGILCSCVHYQWPFTFSYWICPIHKAAYWTYTPLPMFRAIKTCSRTPSCSHNPMDFRGWDEGPAQNLSACSFPCRQPLTWQYEQGKSVNF